MNQLTKLRVSLICSIIILCFCSSGCERFKAFYNSSSLYKSGNEGMQSKTSTTKNDLNPLPVQYIEAHTPTKADMENVPSLLGEIRGDVETTFSFKTPGTITLIGPNSSRSWNRGEFIKKGTVLVKEDQSDLLSNLAKMQAQEVQLHNALNRAIILSKGSVISKADLDVARSNWESAQANLDQAKQALNDSVIIAPNDGYVLDRLAEISETATPGKPIIQFGNFDKMKVSLSVPDRLINTFKLHTKIPFSVSALEGRIFYGKVTEVSMASNNNSRLFRVQLLVDNSGKLLRSGMTASVPILSNAVLDSKNPGVLIPLIALVTDVSDQKNLTNDSKNENESDSKSLSLVVYIIGNDNRVHKERIVPKDIFGNSVLVDGNIKPGDKIVVVSSDEIYNGALVSPSPLENENEEDNRSKAIPLRAVLRSDSHS